MLVTDIVLVQAAQAGDVGAMALLLERHRSRIHAVCIALLGTSQDAGDIVHDVFFVALRRIADLVDPDAAGAWLVGIARNLCLQRRRERRAEPIDVLYSSESAATDPDPERFLHDRALADWVWAAITDLSEPLRAVVMLRYFTQASSYDSMAAVLGIPVGTVRSRLNEGRRRLVTLLREQASRAHGDHAALVRTRRTFFDQVNAEYNRGQGCTHLLAALRPDATLHKATSARAIGGRGAIARGIQSDIDAGMRLRFLDVIAGQDITVIEGALENPADDPQHCPPFTTQVFFHEGEYIRALRLHYAGG